MDELKRLLSIRNEEDFYGYKTWIDLGICIFLIVMGFNELRIRIIAHLLLLFWMSINVQQIFTLFERKKCGFILLENPKTDLNIFYMIFQASLVENLVYILMCFIQIKCFFRASIFMSIIITIIHSLFAIALGFLVSQVRHKNIGCICLCIYYMFNFIVSMAWTYNEFWRHIFVTSQLYNVHIFDFSNNIAIIFWIIILFIMGYLLFENYNKINLKIKVLLTMITMVAFVSINVLDIISNNNISYEQNNVHITTEMNIWTGAVEDICKELKDRGIDDLPIEGCVLNQYHISYLYHFYQTRPVLFMIEGDQLYINIFAHAMINFNEFELAREMLDRLYAYLEMDINSQDNNYIHQIIDGHKSYIMLKVCDNLPINIQDEFKRDAQNAIAGMNNKEVTSANFVKKIVQIMDVKYQEYNEPLYHTVRKNLPENIDEFIEIFTQEFKPLLQDEDISNILNQVKEEK